MYKKYFSPQPVFVRNGFLNRGPFSKVESTIRPLPLVRLIKSAVAPLLIVLSLGDPSRRPCYWTGWDPKEIVRATLSTDSFFEVWEVIAPSVMLNMWQCPCRD